MILVYFNETVTKPNQRVKRSFYIFPKKIPNTSPNDIGVIGGTFIEGATYAQFVQNFIQKIAKQYFY